jgi:tripartite-type tricarboxylate transporter receptor subunit TctC
LRAALLSLPALIALALAPATAAADAISDFYKGRSMRLVIGFSAGGGYDLYSRTVIRHMINHIPGRPNIVPQNMPGVGSRRAANWLYSVAPQDGSVFGTVGLTTPLDQALKAEGVKFDVAKFNWVGNPIIDTGITFTWAASGLLTIADVQKKGGLICGGTGATSLTVLAPVVLNNLLGLKARVISGYPGGEELHLALERGEVNCRGADGWSSVKATDSDWLRDHKISVLVQWGIEADPEISKVQGRTVPNIVDLGKTDEDRSALRLIATGNAMGRPMLAPPNVPAERVKALRDAFDATMKDPAYLADAEKQKMDIRPLSGEQLQALAVETASASAGVMKRVNELIAVHHLETVKTEPGKAGK